MIMMIENHAVQFLIGVNTGEKDIFGLIESPWNITTKVMSAIGTHYDGIYGNSPYSKLIRHILS